MLYIPKIDEYLEILTDEEVKDFAVINFSESVKEERNLRKVAKSLYLFLATPDEVHSNFSDNYIRHYDVKILNLLNPELQLTNTKLVIKSKLEGLLNDLKKFKVQTILVLDYKKRDDNQIFHSCTKKLLVI